MAYLTLQNNTTMAEPCQNPSSIECWQYRSKDADYPAAGLTVVQRDKPSSEALKYEQNLRKADTVLSAIAPASNEISDERVFYFGVTHSANIHSKLDACLQTWCSRIHAHTGRRVIWYSNAPDPRIDHVISYEGGDEYSLITYRMALIWKHVSETYPDFQWYARFWDDNYVIPETFESLIPRSANVTEPLEIGRLALSREGGRLVPVDSEGSLNVNMLPYMDGGAGSLLSHEAMKRLANGASRCLAWFKSSAWKQVIPFWEEAEDLTFGICEFKLFGIQFKRGLGLYHSAPRVPEDADHLCKHEAYGYENPAEVSVPKTFHYVSPEAMFFIDQKWYECPH